MLNTRVFLAGGSEAVARAAVDWMVAHQSSCDVLVAPRAPDARPIGRLAHPPFRQPDPALLDTATRVAALLAAPPPETGASPETGPAPLQVAAALAVASSAPLLVSGGGMFPGLAGISVWSMNLPSRPTDVLFERHAAIAARAWPRIAGDLAATPRAVTGAPMLAALLAGDRVALESAARARRRAARADGPVRFRRIAPRSAGLRPFAAYLDLLPILAAAGEPARTLLGTLPPERAEDLLGMSIALFF